MTGRICLVTGAAGGMGRVIATELARRGARVVAVCRSQGQADALTAKIAAAAGGMAIETLLADLSRQGDIRRLAATFRERHDRLHVLVNNAGAHFRERRLSEDGIELHLAVNHVAPFLLTNLLADLLKTGAPARIVNVASQSIADTRQIPLPIGRRPATLDLSDLNAERHFGTMETYASSKLALVMCGYALSRRLAGSGVTVNALHPGLVATGIIDDIAPSIAKPFLGLIKRVLRTPEQGARSAIHLATAPEVSSTTGGYFFDGKPIRSPPISYDQILQESLWDQTAAQCRSRDPSSDALSGCCQSNANSFPQDGVHSLTAAA